jgi:hypothetical protein
VARPEEIVGAIDIAKSSGAAALNVLAGPLMFNNRQTIVERVAALGLPAMFQSPEIAEYGGFIAYGARLDQLYRDVKARQLVMLARVARVKPRAATLSMMVCRLLNMSGAAKTLSAAAPELFAISIAPTISSGLAT